MRRVATWNCQSLRDYSYVIDEMHSKEIDYFLLQEVCLDMNQIQHLKSLARFRSIEVFFGTPLFNGNRWYNGLVTLVRDHHYAIQVRPLGISDDVALVLQVRGDFSPLLVNLHLTGSWSMSRKSSFVESIFRCAHEAHIGCYVAGDWNCETHEAAVANLDAKGILRVADPTAVLNEPTRYEADGSPGRHIDYLCYSECLPPPHSRSTFQPPRFRDDGTRAATFSDHIGIVYDIDAKATVYHQFPKRITLVTSEFSDDELARRWILAWDDTDRPAKFYAALAKHDTEIMWQLLSDGAEDVLADDAVDSYRGLPRHCIGDPSKITNGGRVGICRSNLLKRIDSIYGRVLQLHKQPHDIDLRDKIYKNCSEPDLIARVPAIAGITDLVTLADLEILKMERERLAELESEQAISAWQRRMLASDNEAAKWVNRKAEREVIATPVPSSDAGDHLQQKCAMWKELWSWPGNIDDDALVKHMERLDLGEHPCPEVCFHGDELLARAKKIHASSGSVDGWRPAQLALLPIQWHRLLAVVATSIFLHGGAIPTPWKYSRVKLIPKSSGGDRPITVAAAAWRLCVSCLVAHLRPWILTWLDKAVVGGAPNCEADDLLSRFENALELALCEDSYFIFGASIDLSKFFDRISATMCLKALRKCGLPSSICDAFEKFYSEHFVYFGDSATVTPGCFQRTHGILQGCGFSIVMVLLIMTVWAKLIASRCPSLAIGVFVDDRLLWNLVDDPTPGGSGVSDLKVGCDITADFDRSIGMVQNLGKGFCFTSATCACDAMVSQFSNVGKLVDDFTYVGIEYSTDPVLWHREVDLKPERMEKVKRRCRRIASVAHSKAQRMRLLSMCVAPVIRWGGAWRNLKPKSIKDVAMLMENCVINGFARRTWAGRSPYLMWCVQLGARNHPQCVIDFEAVNFQVRRLRKSLLEPHRVPTLANFDSVRQRLNWFQWAPYVYKTPFGVVDLGRISKQVLYNIVEASFKQWFAGGDNRCPQVPLNKMIVDDAHHELVHGVTPTWITRWATLGGIVDWRAAKMQKVPAAPCRCGQVDPTRRHWMYDCDQFDDFCPPELDNDGLGIALVDAPDWSIDNQKRGLSALVQRWLCSSTRHKLLATDGSRRDDDMSGFGLASFDLQAFSYVSGIDHSTWASELEPLEIVIAARALVPPQFQVLRIASDCLNIVNTFNELLDFCRGTITTWSCPRFGFRRWLDIEQGLRSSDLATISLIWIPSHGKQAAWLPCDSIWLATEYRQLNDSADTLAKEGALQCANILKVSQHWDERARIKAAMLVVLRRCALGAHELWESTPKLLEKFAHATTVAIL
jgi:hypothetical protein